MFERVTAERIDFSRLTFAHFVTEGSRFVDCDFTGVRFRPYVASSSADRPSTFVRCTFDQADLRRFAIRGTRFEQCSFRHAKINGWRGECAEFVGCTFACRLSDVVFYGRPVHCFETTEARAENDAVRLQLGIDPGDDSLGPPRRTRNEFTGNDFADATIRDVGFRCGIVIGDQRWPKSDSYYRFDRWPEREAVVRAAILEWPASAERARALELVDIYWGPFQREQSEVILPLDAFQGWLGRDGVGVRVLELVKQA